MKILLADDGLPFDGRTPEERPLGGAESAVVSLLNALAARGHEVHARTATTQALTHRGVTWAPLSQDWPSAPDLYIINRSWRLLDRVPDARRRVFWIHNPAGYLLKWRFLSRLWRTRPLIVFSGRYHAASYPRWAPDGGRQVIPYGIDDLFRTAPRPADVPPPRAVFTSNPLRGLDWLLDLWVRDIRPAAPAAELHIFAGSAVYGGAGNPKAAAMEAVLDRARALSASGVIVRGTRPKPQLLEELLQARVMLYRGDPGETFCLAVGEAQAAGIPAVVQPIGSLPERVVHGVTGLVAPDAASFAAGAVHLLTDPMAWVQASEAAVQMQRGWGWDDAARAFERLART